METQATIRSGKMRRDQAGALFTANRHDMRRVKADLPVVWEDLRETE